MALKGKARRDYQRKWRKQASPELLKRQYDRSQQRRKEIAAWLKDYKRERKCARCLESRWACLDFHHRNPGEKSFLVNSATIYQKGYGKKKLLEEIAKCDLICSNCHRVEHHGS